MAGARIEVIRSVDRFTTSTGLLTSRHSFSFGAHYDPHNIGHRLLVAHNEDVVQPGGGYDLHPHRDLEIVTWVLDGSLVHADSEGRGGTVRPGLAQRMSAGSGISHSERNDDGAQRVSHFVQMWVLPRRSGGRPGYAQHDVSAALGSGDLVPLASGTAEAAVSIDADATLHVARLAGARRLPDAPYLHVFVAAGSVDLEGGGRLDAGDAARLTDAGGVRVDGSAEVLVWEMR